MRAQPARFVDEARYRLRRARDAALILPALGAILFVAPVLWGGGSARSGGLYLFVCWFVLILVSFALARRLRGTAGANSDGDQGPSGGDPW